MYNVYGFLVGDGVREEAEVVVAVVVDAVVVATTDVVGVTFISSFILSVV